MSYVAFMGAVLTVSVGSEGLPTVSTGVGVCGVMFNEVRMLVPPGKPAGIRAEAFMLAVWVLGDRSAAVFAGRRNGIYIVAVAE